MNKSRLEAFSDGVMAIIITIMVLEMKEPASTAVSALKPVIPVFVSYLLSFIYVAIYWINHHNIFRFTSSVNNWVLWANLNLLFWMSLIPFTTGWVGENHLESVPVAFYGGVLLMTSVSFIILETAISRYEGEKSRVRTEFITGWKEKTTLVVYAVAVPSAFLSVFISVACYVAVAALWMIPAENSGNAES